MKKSLQFLVLSSLMLSGFSAVAQKGLKYTLFVMPQSVTMRNSDDKALEDNTQGDAYRYTYLWGMAAGGYLGYNPSENFGIKTGLLYSHQGNKHTAKANYLERYRFVTRLDYLKVPIMMGVHSNYWDNKAVFSFYGGYQFGFLLGGQTYDNVKEYVPPISPNISKYPGIREIYSKYNGSIVVETGLDFKLTETLACNLKLRGDYAMGDAENKNAKYRTTEGGTTQYKNWWALANGGSTRAQTHNLNYGLLIGVTYNMIPEEKIRKPMPEKVRKEKQGDDANKKAAEEEKAPSKSKTAPKAKN